VPDGFERLRDFARRIVAVPKKEVEAKAATALRAAARKPRAR
jgi:hypothetical protein